MIRRIGALEAGGTKMVLAVGTTDGKILEQESIPTTTPDETCERMIAWFADKDIEALGIAAFGPTRVDPAASDFGYILDTPKEGWAHFDFLGTMRAGLGVPVGYDTDVNGSCLGEASFGCAQGLDNVVYVTIGTGIGAGVMVGGQLLHGMLHPEAGHIHLEMREDDPGSCTCPFHGSCFEGLASGPALEARWGAKGIDLADRDEVWDLEAHYIAQGVANYILCYAPRKVILGGGVMKQRQLFDLIRTKVARNLNGYLNCAELDDLDSYIVPNSLNENQGILGCVELGRRALEG